MVGARNLTSPRPMQLVPTDLLDWMASNDVGASSQTIACVLSGIPQSSSLHGEPPYDSADFGRCMILLRLFPEWQGRLSEVAEAYPRWEPFVIRWNELARLWYSEKYRDCTQLLREINYAAEPPRAVK